MPEIWRSFFLGRRASAWVQRTSGRDAVQRDTFLTAEMARDFGIVDKVIDRRLIENSAGKE
jgi:hypothetical protein